MSLFALRVVVIAVLIMSISDGVTTALAQNSDPPDKHFKAAIDLRVTADEVINSRVFSYLSRAIRDIDGLFIVDELDAETCDPFCYQLAVVALEDLNVEGESQGFVLSMVTKSPINRWYLEDYLEDTWKSFHRLEQHIVVKGPDLQGLCEMLIASFDVDVLEKPRSALEEMQGQDNSR